MELMIWVMAAPIRSASRLPLLPLEAPEQLAGIGRYVADQRISGVQLAQQANDVFLCRRVAAALLIAKLPKLLDRAFAIHEADQAVGRRRQPMRPARGVILKHEPDLIPIGMPMDLDMAAQSRLQWRHAIPGRGEQGPCHCVRATMTRSTS